MAVPASSRASASRHADRQEWLSLGPASRLVGVDPDTLRRWADVGRIRSFTTPGGHRRLARADVARLQEARRSQKRPLATLGATPERMARAFPELTVWPSRQERDPLRHVQDGEPPRPDVQSPS